MYIKLEDGDITVTEVDKIAATVLGDDDDKVVDLYFQNTDDGDEFVRVILTVAQAERLRAVILQAVGNEDAWIA